MWLNSNNFKNDYENLLKLNKKIDELNKCKTEFDDNKKESRKQILREKLRSWRAEQYRRKSEQKENVQMNIFNAAALRALLKSALIKTLVYDQNYKSIAYNVFLDGRLEIDNNES